MQSRYQNARAEKQNITELVNICDYITIIPIFLHVHVHRTFTSRVKQSEETELTKSQNPKEENRKPRKIPWNKKFNRGLGKSLPPFLLTVGMWTYNTNNIQRELYIFDYVLNNSIKSRNLPQRR